MRKKKEKKGESKWENTQVILIILVEYCFTDANNNVYLAFNVYIFLAISFQPVITSYNCGTKYS